MTGSVSKNDEKVIKELKDKGFDTKDMKTLIKSLQSQNSHQQEEYNIGKNNARYGLISDTHVGNINYDPKLLKHAAKQFDKEGVDFIVHAGDVMDGWYRNRPQSIFEQNAIGLDEQLKKTVEEFKQFNQPIYFITGNHEYNTFMRNAGIEVGPYLEDKLNNKNVPATFMGNAEGDLKTKSNSILRTMHPDGGTSYALSYKSQKIAESLESGKKPHVLHIGHYHKAEYMFYRNIHIFQAGTLMGQSKFMKGKQIPAHKSFWIIDVNSKSDGHIDRVVNRFYPAYR